MSVAILSLLKSLPPSGELLKLYHEKLEHFVEEEQKYLERLKAGQFYAKQLEKVIKENQELRRDLDGIRSKYEKCESALIGERKLVNKLYGENDKLRIQELEDRRKVQIILQMSGKSDSDIIRILDGPAGRERKLDLQVPERLQNYAHINETQKIPPMKKTRETLCLENKALETQLVEQERCHVEQISRLENEKRLLARVNESLKEQFNHRFNELSLHINKLEENKSLIVQDLTDAKKELRKSESKWNRERETYIRKTQFLERYGDVLKGNEDVPGFHTNERALDKRSFNSQQTKTIKRLNTDIADQKNIIEAQRSQILSYEAELEGLKDSYSACRDMLKKRSKMMVDQVETLKNRYENLDQRRKSEATGYQTDVKLLGEKLRDVERQLIAASLAKSKEHDYIKTIKKLTIQNEKLTKDLKQKPGWVNP